MTDDKVIPIDNGYAPVRPPPSQQDLERIHDKLGWLMEEVLLLSQRINQLTRLLGKKEK